ncbi:hypothetical protein ACFWN7_06950 [Agromyces sp. NPDC058484]|uniref:hypothetical protein n=1 Tax=Agromyces sp. NPDC058484 TaxID=3346524 RepID=UPI00365D481A
MVTDSSGPDAAGPDAAGSDAAGLDAAGLIARVHELVTAAAATLGAAAAREEAVAEFVPERRVLGVRRAARMTATGRVWRLGVLLVGADGRLYATGRVVRAERATRRSIPANAIAEQRAFRAAAVKGGLPVGETVNFGADPIDVRELVRAGASGPLVLRGGVVLVRWNPTQPDALTPLDRYLADRVELLVHPPGGA